MSEPEDDEDRPSPTETKVGRVIHEYDLGDTGAWLEAAWLGDGVERRSLRDLADAFNRRVLRAAMVEAGMEPLEREVDSAYEVLSGDEASSGDRVELRNQLEWEDVDTETVERDFVTHQAIHNYLRNYRGAEHTNPEIDPKKEQETIERLRGRTKAVTANSVTRLRKRGGLDIEDFEVIVDIRVICGDCGSQYQVGDLLDAGGCNC